MPWVFVVVAVFLSCTLRTAAGDDRPNVLFAIADDWGWPHAGAYGDPVVATPTFDRLAHEGVLFRQAYVSSPSCTPSRNAILTGQWHWRLGPGANLWSVFPDRFETYPELLHDAGYEVGTSGKSYGPGRTETKGRQLAGRPYRSFAEFLAQRDADKPFCYWLGSQDPHRPYDEGSGAASGMDLARVRLPACFPDNDVTRGDVADYVWEVQRFDALVGGAVAELEERGLLDRTIVVMTGDHGMPFPRGKSNLYDTGTRVPLAIRWPAGGVAGDRIIDDFVSLTDLAPTFLAAAGLTPGDKVTGRSLINVLTDARSGRIEASRNHVLVGKERHVPSQEAPDMGGYPSRAIRTDDFLYVRNFAPERWPNGTPHYERAALPGTWYGDTDNGPTKTYMIEHRDDDATHRRLYELSFGHRPAEELYDLAGDPEQMDNVADDAAYTQVKHRLATQLDDELRASNDPRIVGGGKSFDEYPYFGGGPKHLHWAEANRP
ncbi:MAG: sulfatase [Planctomycetales bacterium]|nr:sulfatase [Planctomycetales bacterium]